MKPFHSPRLSAIERAVLVTLAYTDQFDFPLTTEELFQRCLRQEISAELTESQLKTALEHLQKLRLITQLDTFWVLKNRSEIVSSRRQSAVVAQRKQQELELVTNFLQSIPWVKAIYLTGSQAMNVADSTSDLDFMLVTVPKRLWLTRIIVSCYAQWQGKRRSWNNEEPGSWCFNLWLDSGHLSVAPDKQDSYRAYEVLQAKPLWTAPGYAQLFVHKNSWIKNFFFARAVAGLLPSKTELSLQPERSSLLHHWWSWLDLLAWKFQSWYMKRHQTTEHVGRGYAFFHPRDTKNLIVTGWMKSLESCLPKEQVVEILQPYVRS